jgi:Leucine-rich repeat (LRR) protein
MGAASTVLTQHDLVYRLRLNEYIDDDEALVLFLKTYLDGKYLLHFANTDSSSSKMHYSVSPEIIQNDTALFWFIRLRFRDLRRTVADSLAYRIASGEEVGVFSLDYNEISSSHAPPPVPADTPYIISAECSDLRDLDYVVQLVNQNCIVANLGNNSIGDKEIEKHSGSIMASNIKYLQIGGNQLKKLVKITPVLPVGLLVLDLSFTEGLEFTFDCLKSCFQLMRLVLDGCGLQTTVVVNSKNGQQQSLFQYLYCLQELSLKDNALDNIAALGGLTELSRSSVETLTSAVSLSGFGTNSTPASSLRSLWLADNPICEISHVYSEVISMLLTQLPSITHVDDKPVRASKPTAFNMLSAKYSRDNANTGDLDSRTLDAANAEFVAALKGEKDVSIVA